MREDCESFISSLVYFGLHYDTNEAERQAAMDAADAVGALLDVVFGEQ